MGSILQTKRSPPITQIEKIGPFTCMINFVIRGHCWAQYWGGVWAWPRPSWIFLTSSFFGPVNGDGKVGGGAAFNRQIEAGRRQEVSSADPGQGRDGAASWYGEWPHGESRNSNLFCAGPGIFASWPCQRDCPGLVPFWHLSRQDAGALTAPSSWFVYAAVVLLCWAAATYTDVVGSESPLVE